MKLGTMDHVVRGRDELDSWKQAAAIGLKGVEVNVRPADVRGRRAARAKEINDLKAGSGMAVPSLCMGFHNDEGFIARPKELERASADISEALELCKMVGASVLLSPFFGGNTLEPTADNLRRTAEILKPLCARAHALGVTLLFEGTIGAKDLWTMAREIDSPGFGVYFDLANVVWVGLDGPQQILDLGKLIRQVHMKEFKNNPGDVQPGQGRVNYAESAKALKQIGYDGWLMLETPAGEAKKVAEDIAFTRKFFPNL